MSKAFKLIIVLIFSTYHFSFVFCEFYSEPIFINRPRKSGTRPRFFKSNWPRKAFDGRDRKALDISDIYSEKFLQQIESRLQSKSPEAQQWQAAVETTPRKKEKFPERAQKSRQEENLDVSKELPLNVLEEATNDQKNSQKEIQQLKEEIRKEKQNQEDRKKKEKALSIETPETSETSEQIESKKLESEQIRNLYFPKSSQTAVVEKNTLRGGKHHSRQHGHDNHCIKKCYTPKCEVECIGRQASAACSANKCKASTRGLDSAAVCKGEKCLGSCLKDDCIAACEGDSCSVTCEGKICHAVSEGRRTKSACEGDNCVAYAKGAATRPTCKGSICQTWCVGDGCVAKCRGFNCEAMCSGDNCKAQCVGKNCTQSHNPGKPGPERPWVLEKEEDTPKKEYTTKKEDTNKKEDSKSQEISISNESRGKSNLPTKPNKNDDDDDYDGYYGNKKHVKNTINDKDEDDVPNSNGNIDNNGKSDNLPSLPVGTDEKGPGAQYGNKNNDGHVTIDYSIAIKLSKQLGEYLRKKVFKLQDVSLLRYLPNLIRE